MFFRVVFYKGECYTAPECAARNGISNSSCARQEILCLRYKRVNYDSLGYKTFGISNLKIFSGLGLNTRIMDLKSDDLFSGFGVCCYSILSECGGTVTKNQSYIRNPGYNGEKSLIQR